MRHSVTVGAQLEITKTPIDMESFFTQTANQAKFHILTALQSLPTIKACRLRMRCF